MSSCRRRRARPPRCGRPRHRPTRPHRPARPGGGAPRAAGDRPDVGEQLQPRRATARWLPVLHLVPVPLGLPDLGADLHGLPHRPGRRPHRPMDDLGCGPRSGPHPSHSRGSALVRHLDHLVPARRRPLHRLHLHRGPAAMWRPARFRFFAVPPHLLYPIIFIFMGRMWSVSHRHGTSRPPTSCAAVRSACRWPSPSPASSRRCRTSHSSWSASRPCSKVVASAAATASSPRTCRCSSRSPCCGLHLLGRPRPAVIAFVKDTLIYLVIIVAIIYLPTKFGGGPTSSTARPDGRPTRSTQCPRASPWSIATPATLAHSGSALA